MGSFSIVHWIVVVFIIALLASPIMGIVRGVKNGSVLNAVVSVFIPLYGLIYFFAAKRASQPARLPDLAFSNRARPHLYFAWGCFRNFGPGSVIRRVQDTRPSMLAPRRS